MGFLEQLKLFREKIDAELKCLVDTKILHEKDEFLKQVYNFIKDFIFTGGKRLRPALILATYNAIKTIKQDDDYENICKVALSLELFHNYTLIHDDIIDEDLKRRNSPNINSSFYNRELNIKDKEYLSSEGKLFFRNKKSQHIVSQSLVTGDILSMFGINAILDSDVSENKKLKLLKIYSETNENVGKGQLLDVEYEHKDISEEQYLNMIFLKTGYLFASAIRVGAILANANETQIDKLVKFAETMAPAFQIQDDIMDIYSPESKGNSAGADIREGKNTLLIIKAKELVSEEDKKILLKVIGNKNALTEEINQVATIIETCGALDYCKNYALELINSAKKHLQDLEFDTSFFEAFADFMVNRSH